MVDKKTKRKLRRIWCERLFIGLSVSVALGFSIVKVQSVYSLANLIKEEEQAKEVILTDKQTTWVMLEDEPGTQLMLEDVKTKLLMPADKMTMMGMGDLIWMGKPQEVLKAQQQKLQQESLFIAISVLCFIIMLILLLRQRNRISLTLAGQLICFFPEECIAELEALRQQLKSEHYSTSLIRVIMFRTFLELLCVFYIQNNIENLLLPQHKGRKHGDE